ncbi:hypothetical protein EMIHUDRAFT_255148 [Emiliania huxleyi CCMP1516]|uniref:Uncharacterized protein n=2 Tax=Emiliania huxleyi TaxID=2903 RepID=A0A0D3JEV1_EMIH1|nr:hypothetical protein EMIHUDRAFT_255148 [Emiliania huxleyi CCMP1516]EOD22036.1 hypothetical protein EMIHUDRAFT_255148 [Emiliania huxleyi CCMP1516]|eukprot:XP_005774465.1 hypothetical protein EMIHUDRAFT_255148 [Emiliania huxleyi CCMP1516]
MPRELPWLQHKESKRIVPVVGSAAQFLQPACDGPAPADRLHFAPPAALLLEHGANVNSVQHSTLGPLVPLVPFQPAGVAGVLGGAPAPFAPPPQARRRECRRDVDDFGLRDGGEERCEGAMCPGDGLRGRYTGRRAHQRRHGGAGIDFASCVRLGLCLTEGLLSTSTLRLAFGEGRELGL